LCVGYHRAVTDGPHVRQAANTKVAIAKNVALLSKESFGRLSCGINGFGATPMQEMTVFAASCSPVLSRTNSGVICSTEVRSRMFTPSRERCSAA
jgi:hypothetical protein